MTYVAMAKKLLKIFPDYLISGSVKNQKELDAAFQEYPSYSKRFIQTALYSGWQNDRKWYEKNWPNVCNYLDKNFLKAFQAEDSHSKRAWEFYLATILVNKGFRLLNKTQDDGPDFCIEAPNGKKVWIEAIACSDGDVRVKPYSLGANQYDIEEMQHNRVLRITSAFYKKFKKFCLDIENVKIGIRDNDCLVIAISGADIQQYSDDQALFERAMFARGLESYTKIPNQRGLQRGYLSARPVKRTTKDNLVEEIKTEPMVMNDFSKISAVLYSGYSIGHSSWSGIGNEFLFAYHENPLNPIPENFFNFGLGIKKNMKTAEIMYQKYI